MITGGAGYIGGVLAPALTETGRHVVVVDSMLFRPDLPAASDVEYIAKDIRDLRANDLHGVDEVIDLAAISSDQASAVLPRTTWEVNDAARRRVAALAKAAGARRYLLPSSSNLYGSQTAAWQEMAKVEPLSVYAKANRQAELGVLAMADATFAPVVLRQATVYGWSPNMRFDLVVNAMTAAVVRDGRCGVMGDGTQVRPLVSIGDVVRTHLAVLEAEHSRVSGLVFNVGADDEQHRIADLPPLIGEVVGVAPETFRYGDLDPLSHRLDYGLLRRRLGLVLGSALPAAVSRLATEIERNPDLADDDRTRRAAWLEASGVPDVVSGPAR